MSNIYTYYPRLDDPDFYKKIYLKKEFNKNKILPDRRTFDEICNSKVMKLMPQQKFLKNYISVNTPYNSVLIFHSTGVGKTCTAISIAEGFKSLILNENRRIVVIVNNNIISQFRKEIYNPGKEDLKKIDLIVFNVLV